MFAMRKEGDRGESEGEGEEEEGKDTVSGRALQEQGQSSLSMYSTALMENGKADRYFPPPPSSFIHRLVIHICMYVRAPQYSQLQCYLLYFSISFFINRRMHHSLPHAAIKRCEDVSRLLSG